VVGLHDDIIPLDKPYKTRYMHINQKGNPTPWPIHDAVQHGVIVDIIDSTTGFVVRDGVDKGLGHRVYGALRAKAVVEAEQKAAS
jgi:hypothetical protein